MRKTVIITGATDGLGKALAIMLSKEYNLEFYKKCGFEIVKEIYDNKG